MITTDDLRTISIFKEMPEGELQQLARKAEELQLLPGDWLNREGAPANFYVLLQGHLSLYKNIVGRYQELTEYGKYRPGDFLGELPIMIGARNFALVKADVNSRVARFEPEVLLKLIRDSDECRDVIMKKMNERLLRLQQFHLDTVNTRVLIKGSHHDQDCRVIRNFLTMSRIPFDWINNDEPSENIPPGIPDEPANCAVHIDNQYWLSKPTVRSVAEALGVLTRPTKPSYDVAIIGGGPAGLAAAVYGASEGLNVLMIERHAAGGQAGTSTNIENYLGFPNGISGEDLGEKALQQAMRFGAEMVFTREVKQITRLANGTYSCKLDGGQSFVSKTVILSTGVSWRCYKADGIERLRGRGVLYGAERTESAAVTNKDIFIVGGGNSAGQAAVYFANFAKSVTIMVRGQDLKHSMSHYLIDHIQRNNKITVLPKTNVIAAAGVDHLESITTVTDGGSPEKRKADALFILIGATTHTGWLPEELQRDEDGFVCTGHDVTELNEWQENRPPYMLETNLPGFFCAGDVRHSSIKRVSSAVGEGSMAIAFVHQYLAVNVNRPNKLLIK